MEKKSKDIKSQLQQGYKLQTLMHKVNKEKIGERMKEYNKKHYKILIQKSLDHTKKIFSQK